MQATIRSIAAAALALILTASATAQGADSNDLGEVLGNLAARELSLKVKSVTILERTETHVTRELILENKRLGQVRVFKKDPAFSMLAQWPTVFLLTGLTNGPDTIQLLPDVEDVSFLVLDYPVNAELENADLWVQFAQNLPKMIGQIVATYMWLEQQADVDANRIASLNISFGTFIAPAALRLLADMKKYPSHTIFAFGGADLDPFFDGQVKNAEALRLLKSITKVMNPARHFNRLRGPFLVLDASRDQVIPQASADSLFAQLPEPKTRVAIDTDHVNRDKPDVIAKAFAEIDAWLKAENF